MGSFSIVCDFHHTTPPLYPSHNFTFYCHWPVCLDGDEYKMEQTQIIEEEINQSSPISGTNQDIDWNKFGSDNYIRIPEGEPVELLLTNWRQTHRFDNEQLEFDVLELNGKPQSSNMFYSVGAKKAVFQFKPIIQNAKENKKANIRIKIIKLGSGYDTIYKITSLD